jgi:hypothetical protein
MQVALCNQVDRAQRADVEPVSAHVGYHRPPGLGQDLAAMEGGGTGRGRPCREHPRPGAQLGSPSTFVVILAALETAPSPGDKDLPQFAGIGRHVKALWPTSAGSFRDPSGGMLATKEARR